MLYFEPFFYMSFKEDSKIFIKIDMDIEENFGDMIKFKIVTILKNGTFPITRKSEFIMKNEREFQRDIKIQEFSEYYNM